MIFNSKEYKEKMKNLKPIFEVGDKVKILIGISYMIGKTAIITKVSINDKEYVVKDREEYLYFIDGEEKCYSYEYFFEIDREYDRDKKINTLLDGLS